LADYEIVKVPQVGEDTVTGATEAAGRFGPQLRLVLESKRVVFVPAKSGIAKGLLGGKLKLPVKVVSAKGISSNGPYSFLALRGKNGAATEPTE
jgi:hypothetical protein